jgi:hypothetical protein
MRAHMKVQTIVLGSVYVHPKLEMSEVPLLFYSTLARYGKNIQNVMPNLKVELDVPYTDT